MKMKHRKWLSVILLVAAATVSGCGGIAKHASTNSSSNQKLESAQIYYLSSGTITARYTQYPAPESAKAAKAAQIQRDVSRFADDMKKYLPNQVAAAFKQRNIANGNGAIVALKPIDFYEPYTDRLTIRFQVTVSVYGQAGPPWTITIDQMNQKEAPFGEPAAAYLSQFIIAELVKAGFLAAV